MCILKLIGLIHIITQRKRGETMPKDTTLLQVPVRKELKNEFKATVYANGKTLIEVQEYLMKFYIASKKKTA
jgi:hypothetical protein